MRRPLANVSPARGFTSTWSSPSARYSTGSSIVVSWRSGVLSTCRQAKSVVVLPDPVGPTDDDGAERLRDRPLERRLAPRRHAEVIERLRRLALREDAQRHLLPVRRRQDGHADVERLVATPDREPAVLGRAPLGDVEPAHDLEAAETAVACVPGNRGQLAHDAVDADPDVESALLRREVDVGGAEVERRRDRPVDEDDGRRLVVEVENARGVLDSCASLTTSSIGPARDRGAA